LWARFSAARCVMAVVGAKASFPKISTGPSVVPEGVLVRRRISSQSQHTRRCDEPLLRCHRPSLCRPGKDGREFWNRRPSGRVSRRQRKERQRPPLRSLFFRGPIRWSGKDPTSLTGQRRQSSSLRALFSPRQWGPSPSPGHGRGARAITSISRLRE